jgi:type IV secretory pathway VirB3-like protein
MEVLKRLGIVALAACIIGIFTVLFIFVGAVGIPVMFIFGVVCYVIKYVITGEDDENFFG